MSKTYSIDFSRPETTSDLASYIGIDTDLFDEVVSSNNRTQFYIRHEIPKRSRHRTNKFRIVWQAIGPLATAHKRIARRFELFVRSVDSQFPHEAAHGYVRQRGTVDNAKVHCGAPLLLRADLRDFFPSISADRLFARFCELGMKPSTATALARFVTIDDRLPLGLNASPMLANLMCVSLDIKIQELAKAYDCKYTRYADDISISGKEKLPERVELEKIVIEEGFQLSAEKFRITKLGQAHFVTGLSISDPGGPHVPRSMKKRLRQELYYCKKYGIGNHLSRIEIDASLQAGVNRLDGTVRYVGHVESKIAHQLKSQWNRLLKRDDVEASYKPIAHLTHYVSAYVDETEISFCGKNYLALAVAFTEDVQQLELSTVATLREHKVSDPFYAGDKSALDGKGLHFVDSHFDLRAAYVKKLAVLSYRAFVIFGELSNGDDYEQVYISLLKKLLPKRLMWYDGVGMLIIFEENSKVKLSSLKQAVSEAYQLLDKADNRRPAQSPAVMIGKKLEHHCFSIPDYLLAIFSRYARNNEKSDELSKHQFERLRDMYRLIIDADSGIEFSRRRPFSPWPLI